MTKIKELREQQARIATNARAKFEEIKDDTPEARAKEIEGEFDRMMAEHDAIGARAERLAKLESAEARAAEGDERRPQGQNTSLRAGGGGEEVTYRHAFAQMMSGVAPEDMEPEARAVLRKGKSSFENRAQTGATGAAGGFTVPTELLPMIDRAMKAWGPMYDADVATVMVTSSGNPLKLPTIDDTSLTGAAHTEGAVLADDGSQDAVIAQKSLDAFSFDTEFIRWSWELNADSIFSFETLLADLLGERLARLANTQLTTGTGSSAPNGIVTASSLGKTAAAVAAITSDEIIDLMHSVDPAYRVSPKAAFMFNDGTLSAIRKLKDGQGNYLWQMGDVTKGVPGTLQGHRYHINQAMASLATGQKVVLFGDFSKYYVRKVGGPVLGVMRERFWPDMGIAGLIRFDGELAQSGAVKHLITA